MKTRTLEFLLRFPPPIVQAAKCEGLTRDEWRYILDPKAAYGPTFPSKTFRVLKDKEQTRYGEYRTERLVLEARDRLSAL